MQQEPAGVEGMARYGIRSARAWGVPGPIVRRIARGLGRDHRLAARLWATGIFEARAVAALIDDPALVGDRQMERWASAFDSWALCDHVCGKLFDRSPLAWPKARAWARRHEEFVRRAGFALMAWLAVHDKRAPDRSFDACLPLIERAAGDERAMVKKAVNWALRQIGKRNAYLNRRAIACARRIHRLASARPHRSAAGRALGGVGRVARAGIPGGTGPAGGQARDRSSGLGGPRAGDGTPTVGRPRTPGVRTPDSGTGTPLLQSR